MDLKHLPNKKLTTSALMERLIQEGWDSSHDGVAQEFAQRWATVLNTSLNINKVEENLLSFTIHLPHFRLRTMQEVPCLLIAGDSVNTDALKDYKIKYNNPNYLPFILTLSPSAHQSAFQMFPLGRCLILSAEQIKSLLMMDNPQDQLKRLLRDQIPRRTLIPYNFSLPAVGGMFFGRNDELSRLQEEDFISFSIAGPGRIGKTSLLKSYYVNQFSRHNSRIANRFNISFYKSEPTPDGIARFLAMEIRDSKQSDRMTAGGLVNFLRHMRSDLGGPLELLLDEVDEVCQGEAFRYLGEAARMGLCRLVLCGKGGLLKTMLSTKSPLECRLDLIQLGPLDEGSARELLLKPLADLGFQISDEEHFLDKILRLKGRLPNLLQLFGKKLAEIAIQEKAETITPNILDLLLGDFLIAQFFIKSLIDLDDPQTRLIGLLLVEEGEANVSLSSMQALASRCGLSLSSKRVMEVCIDLVINNVLVWNHGLYSLANEGLPFYARQTGYLSNALSEARTVANAHT